MTVVPAFGNDDQALTRVPDEARYSWLTMAVQRFGQLSVIPHFVVGATLGFGMSFGQGFLALTLGVLILELATIAVGIAGQREGLSTAVLARWTGFGRGGSAVVGLAIGLSLIGWFGIQSQLAAYSLAQLVGGLPAWAWSLVLGFAVTVIATYGFRWMAWTAYLTVPAFLALAGWTIASELTRHDLGRLVTEPPPGPHMGVLEAATLIAGGFMVGAVASPDLSRFNRSPGDVVKQAVVGMTLGEWVTGSAGLLLGHALRGGESSEVIAVVTSSTGWLGAMVIVTALLKINDWNLYTASLSLVNFADVTLGRRLNRAHVALVLGAAGSALAAAGALEHLTDFLLLLAVVFPPIPGIMVAEYFLVRRWRAELASARPGLPPRSPAWVPVTLAIWVLATLVGKYAPLGLPSINALLTAALLYAAVGRLGLLRGYGAQESRPGSTEPASSPSG